MAGEGTGKGTIGNPNYLATIARPSNIIDRQLNADSLGIREHPTMSLNSSPQLASQFTIAFTSPLHVSRCSESPFLETASDWVES